LDRGVRIILYFALDGSVTISKYEGDKLIELHCYHIEKQTIVAVKYWEGIGLVVATSDTSIYLYDQINFKEYWSYKYDKEVQNLSAIDYSSNLDLYFSY